MFMVPLQLHAWSFLPTNKTHTHKHTDAQTYTGTQNTDTGSDTGMNTANPSLLLVMALPYAFD